MNSIIRNANKYDAMEASAIIAHDAKRGNDMLNRCVESIKAEGIEDIIVESEGNKSDARNAGSLKAKGEIFIYCDDDIQVRPGSVKEILEPFKDENVGIVGGTNIMFPNAERGERISSSLLASKLTMFRSASRYTPTGFTRDSDESELLSCFMAVRKKAFQKAGGYPVSCVPCEENVLINNVQALGYRIIYQPFAICFHNRPKGLLEHWRKIYEYGTGRGKMLRQFKFKGRPKMMFRPSWDWPLLLIGAIGHYIAYFIGVIEGYIRGK